MNVSLPIQTVEAFLHSSMTGGAEFVEQVGVFFEAEGFSRTAGRIFGRLLLSEKSLSLDQLAADLGVSKASISTETRMLERRGALERTGQAGDRRVYYRVEPGLPVPTLGLRLPRVRRFGPPRGETRQRVSRGNPGLTRR